MTPQPNYVLIDTPEKQLLFAPMKPGDEWAHGDQWQSAATNKPFTPGERYRRPERNAWLPIKDKPVQYPAWILREDGTFRWFETDPINSVTKSAWVSWLPAPHAPEAPAEEDPDTQALNHFLKDKNLEGFTIIENAWQAGRDYERSKKV